MDIVIDTELINGEQGRLGIEGIEYCFHQQQVDAAIHQATNRLGISHNQFIKIHIAVTGIVHIR